MILRDNIVNMETDLHLLLCLCLLFVCCFSYNLVKIREYFLVKMEGIKELVEESESRLIPQKPKDSYNREYEKLMKWMKVKNLTTVNESLMLAYMVDMSKIYKSTFLWCTHSKLQTMLRVKNGVDLATCHKLHAFMKELNKGYEAKKSHVFNEEELRKFVIQAPNGTFLFMKVVELFVGFLDLWQNIQYDRYSVNMTVTFCLMTFIPTSLTITIFVIVGDVA